MNKDFIYKHLKDRITGPTSFEDIYAIFESMGINALEVQEALDDLEKEGKLVKTRMDRYGIPEQMNLLTGRVKKLKKGFGFLVRDNMDTEDLFIPPDCLNSAQNGDRVIVRIMKHGDMVSGRSGHRDECEVVRILERHNKTYVGTYKPKKHYAYVVPDNLTFGQDIIVPLDAAYHAQEGDKVLVEITNWGNQHEIPEGKVITRLGKSSEPGIDVLSLVYRYDLSPSFTKEQVMEAKRIEAEPIDLQLERRCDFRFYSHIVTIDGADSKDLDDAVQLEVLSNGNYMLGVHIADVSEYIKEGSILDEEAYRRGTSVYFVDRVLPMLPPEISNNICSLNANEDRLTVSCVMEINPQGKIISTELSESVINVERRFTYDTVNEILEKQSFDEDPSYVEYFNDMQALSEILHNLRMERGALEFDFPESKVFLDEEGHVVDIGYRERGKAEKIIEEFMILANQTVAAWFFRRKIPFIYRVHEEPEREKMEAFLQYIQRLGIYLPKKEDGEGVTAKDLQWILKQAKEKDCAEIVDMMMLRTMNHAFYTANKTSHFGLGLKQYTHFTSPIRRYSDLSIHRVVKEFVQSGQRMNDHRINHYAQTLPDASEQASSCERNAEEAERASVDIKKAEYMVPFIGQTFTGQIVSVTSFGFFVRLPNSVEGLVHISSLYDDYYNYDADAICLIGEHTGKAYKLGMHLDVVLENVNIKESTIDFVVKGAEKSNKTKETANRKSQKSSHGNEKQYTRKKVQTTATKYKKDSKKRKTNRGPKSNSRKSKGKA